jgi:hypothetical protein
MAAQVCVNVFGHCLDQCDDPMSRGVVSQFQKMMLEVRLEQRL